MKGSSLIVLLRHGLQALSIIALSVFASIPAGAVPDQDPAPFLERYLQGLTSLRADFTQVSSVAGGDTVEKASGRLYLQKPGRFRWDYRQPNEQLIVSDGSNVWLFDKELEQVTVKPIDESLATTPALLLAGKSSVAESFTISGAGSRDGVDWILLVPKRTDTDFVEFRLGFAGGELRAMELKDKLQQATRIEFSDVQRNTRLASDLFTFKPPVGVDVIGTARR
ncbi:MAG TPA: outer membrane lipoprotein chaperone LolA [Steroidobacteraceae bacterium]|nr:outer membrane lipoprotein chaperone LolA [Steroidobacteraceae bacterium]